MLLVCLSDSSFLDTLLLKGMLTKDESKIINVEIDEKATVADLRNSVAVWDDSTLLTLGHEQVSSKAGPVV